jgi:large subunit ribosomal protein L15
MQLHELKIKKSKKPRRVGRGGKRGTTSGRGQKGQKSRAGRRIRPPLRDIIIRIPKQRGFKNKPLSDKPLVFNLGDLRKMKAKLAVLDYQITPETLKRAGCLPPAFRGKIKILAKGEIDFPAIISGLEISKGAAEKVIKAGGRVLPQKA